VVLMPNGQMAAFGAVKVVVSIVNVRFHVRASRGSVSVPPLPIWGQRVAREPLAEQPEQVP
jgi:hypothetical protein